MASAYVILASYDHLEEAWVAKGRLESAGIDCFLSDEHAARHYGLAIGGVKLNVHECDVEAARELLATAVEASRNQQASGNDDEDQN